MALIDIVWAKEQELRLRRSEVGVAYDRNGNVVLQKNSKPGAEYEIEFADAEYRYAENSFRCDFHA